MCRIYLESATINVISLETRSYFTASKLITYIQFLFLFFTLFICNNRKNSLCIRMWKWHNCIYFSIKFSLNSLNLEKMILYWVSFFEK